MQRELRVLLMACAMAFITVASEARGESIGSTCRRICQNEVQACVDGGGVRKKCRRTILKACRRDGVTTCLDAGEEARKASRSTLYAPVVLNATAMSQNLIALGWEDSNTNEQGYSVERSMDGLTFSEITETLANATAYSDPGRLANTTYYYRVRAFRVRRGKYTFSSYSTIASATTMSNLTTTTTLAPTTTTSTSTTSSTSTTVPTVSPTTTTVPTTTLVPTTTTTSTTKPPTTTTSTSTSSSTSSSSTTTIKPTTTSTTSSTSTSSSSSSSTSTSTSTTTTTTIAANQPPVANAGADQLSQTLVMLSFNGSASRDPDGTIVLASWSFGDGATAGGLNVAHSYAAAGTYTAMLTVMDNQGAMATDTAIVTVQNRVPTANAGSDQAGVPGTALTFNGGGSFDPDGTIASYSWSFGDGTFGSGAVVSHAYANAGVYTVTLTVRDNNGAAATDTAVATVTTATSGTWSRSLGGSDSDAAYGLASDANGNVFVAGTFRGSMALGGVTLVSNGGADWFIAKYSPSGALLWADNQGGTSEDSLESIAVDAAGDVVAAGRIAGTASLGGAALVSNGPLDIAVAKYSGANGQHIWSKRFGGTLDDSAAAVAVDSARNVYLTGYFRGVVDFGTGTLRVPYDTDLDVFVAKFDANGGPLWAKNFTNTGNDRGYGIATNGSSVAFVGSFSNGIDFGGGQLFSQNAMIDAFVAVLDAGTGAYQWARQLGAPDGNETAYGVDFNTNGNVVICGVAVKPIDLGGGSLAALGGADGFVAAYVGTSGAHVWSRRLGGTGNDYAFSVVTAGDGTVLVGGSFENSASFGGGSLTQVGLGDAFVAKYSAAGAALWARGLGGGGNDMAQEVAVTPTGQPLVAGYFYDSGLFDGTTLTSAGVADAFVTKMNP